MARKRLITAEQVEAEGELHVTEVMQAKAGDVVFMPKGSQIVFGTPSRVRIFYVTHPANWSGTLSVANAGGFVNFSWLASPQAGLAGYHVYEITSTGFTRLTTTPVTGTSFTSSSAFSTGRKFMVNAVRLEVSPTGTC